MGEIMRPTVEKPKELSEFGLPIARKFEGKEHVSYIECQKPNSDWKSDLQKSEDPFVELAGPSLIFDEFDIIDFQKFQDKLICTNVKTGHMHDKKGSVVDTAEYIDVITKAEELAFANESLGAIFVKDFRIEESSRKKPRPMKGNFDTENNQMIQKVGQEAWRTLKDNGLLVWLDLEKPALINLRNIGFDLVYYQERKFENSSRYQAVFKKDTSRK